MSDIVERLRLWDGGTKRHDVSSTMWEAADEIERLRKEVAYLKSPDREFERDVLRAIAGMQK